MPVTVWETLPETSHAGENREPHGVFQRSQWGAGGQAAAPAHRPCLLHSPHVLLTSLPPSKLAPFTSSTKCAAAAHAVSPAGTSLPHSLLPACHSPRGWQSVNSSVNSLECQPVSKPLDSAHSFSYQGILVCDQDLPDDWILSPHHGVPSTQDSAWQQLSTFGR